MQDITGVLTLFHLPPLVVILEKLSHCTARF
nr:MAG TPA: hypothetical protein [Caudoviricetes sp.]